MDLPRFGCVPAVLDQHWHRVPGCHNRVWARKPAGQGVRPSVRPRVCPRGRPSVWPAASPHLHTARRSIPSTQSAEQLRWRTARRVRVMGRRDATPSVQEDLAPSLPPSLPSFLHNRLCCIDNVVVYFLSFVSASLEKDFVKIRGASVLRYRQWRRDGK